MKTKIKSRKCNDCGIVQAKENTYIRTDKSTGREYYNDRCKKCAADALDDWKEEKLSSLDEAPSLLQNLNKFEAKKNEYNTKGITKRTYNHEDYYIAEPRNKFCKCGVEKTPETTSLRIRDKDKEEPTLYYRAVCKVCDAKRAKEQFYRKKKTAVKETPSAKEFTYNGTTYASAAEAARQFGINEITFRNRIKKGIALEKKVESTEIIVDGVTYSNIRELAVAIGIPYNTVKSRIQHGRSLTVAELSRSNKQPITIKGVEYKSKSEAAKAEGISIQCLIYRLKSGKYKQ